MAKDKPPVEVTVTPASVLALYAARKPADLKPVSQSPAELVFEVTNAPCKIVLREDGTWVGLVNVWVV